MIRSSHRYVLIALSVVFLALMTGIAHAAPIIYTFSTPGGSAGSILDLAGNPLVDFYDAAFDIHIFGNTSGVTSPAPGVFENANLAGTIYVHGGKDVTLTNPVPDFTVTFGDLQTMFADQTTGVVGFYNNVSANDIVDVFAASFGAYDLTSFFMPPTPGDSVAFQGLADGIGLYGGKTVLSIDSLTDSMFFSAEADTGQYPAPVPEPSTLVFLGSGLAGLLGLGWSRRSKR